MALAKWEPFEGLTALQREMNRMFERFFDDGSMRLGERALEGEIKEEEKKEGKNYYRRELRYGAFERTIPLPVAVQAEKATADLKDGVLAVTLPKRETAKAKQIPIQAS
jgi:hypothetical protein